MKTEGRSMKFTIRCCPFRTYPPVLSCPEVLATMEMRSGMDRGPADPLCLSPKWVQTVITSRKVGTGSNPHLVPPHCCEHYWPDARPSVVPVTLLLPSALPIPHPSFGHSMISS